MGWAPAQGDGAVLLGSTNVWTGSNTFNGAVVFAGTVSVSTVLQLPDGTVSAPALTWSAAGQTDCGRYRIGSDNVGESINGALVYDWNATRLQLASALQLTFSTDLILRRAAAASLRLGGAASATPTAQTLSVQEGVGTDIAGASFTFQSGAGTGAGAASSIVFQTPTVGAAGAAAQSLATRLTVATAAVTSTVPFLAPNGTSGAPSISFAADPTVGMYLSGNYVVVSKGLAVSSSATFDTSVGLGATVPLGWTSTTGGGTRDLNLRRIAAASLGLGAAAAADTDGVAQTISSPGGGTATAANPGKAGGNFTLQAGAGSAAKAGGGGNGGNGGNANIYAGAAGAGDGGGVAGTQGAVNIATSSNLLGFYGVTAIARAVLATGAGATVDNVITALQNLGLVKQS